MTTVFVIISLIGIVFFLSQAVEDAKKEIEDAKKEIEQHEKRKGG